MNTVKTYLLSTLLSLGIIKASAAELSYFQFSGGNGTPVLITLEDSIEFTTTTENAQLLSFVISIPDKNLFGTYEENSILSSTLRISINGNDDALSISEAHTFSNPMSPLRNFNHLWINEPQPIKRGDTITLSSGVIVIDSPFEGILPQNGHYEIILADTRGAIIYATTRILVPEPSSFALVAGCLIVFFAVLRHKHILLINFMRTLH